MKRKAPASKLAARLTWDKTRSQQARERSGWKRPRCLPPPPPPPSADELLAALGKDLTLLVLGYRVADLALSDDGERPAPCCRLRDRCWRGRVLDAVTHCLRKDADAGLEDVAAWITRAVDGASLREDDIA